MDNRESNFYCQIKCLGIYFSITEWERAFNMCVDLNMSEEQLSKIVDGEPCKHQCNDCANIVIETQNKTRELINNGNH